MPLILPFTAGVITAFTAYHLYTSKLESDMANFRARLEHMKAGNDGVLPVDPNVVRQPKPISAPPPQPTPGRLLWELLPFHDTIASAISTPSLPKLLPQNEAKDIWNRQVRWIAGKLTQDGR
ncbi:hypothetical protein DFJ73DRAFT_810557 [Zopfochytrium polystomum]|nr:hypothetical protein DFJ73DRAFT_810557 [Zopfochytrium polystomum]